MQSRSPRHHQTSAHHWCWSNYCSVGTNFVCSFWFSL